MKIRITPNGLHLFDRGTGLNVLLDELQPDRTLWSSAPRQVSIALTNVCDLHCQYCYASKHKASLNSNQILQWAKELDVAGCFSLGLGGGEPTLHPEFVDICQKLARDTDLAVTFTTHGQRITPQLVAELRGSVHFIRISTDGVGETYERLRGRPYWDLLKGIELAADIAPFGINVVVNDQTVRELSDISAMAESMGARELLLLPQHPTQNVSRS